MFVRSAVVAAEPRDFHGLGGDEDRVRRLAAASGFDDG